MDYSIITIVSDYCVAILLEDEMGKERIQCPKCNEQMQLRLGQYECPACFHVIDTKKQEPYKPKYRTSTSRLEETLRGKQGM